MVDFYHEVFLLYSVLHNFHIDLSTPATKPLEVELVCERVGGNGVLNITTNRVAFRASQMRQQVLISELDGTANSVSFKGGFSVTARVITETLNEDGIAYKDIYLPATEKIYVANEAPSIVLPVDTGITNSAAINVPIPLKWKVDDVDFDLTKSRRDMQIDKSFVSCVGSRFNTLSLVGGEPFVQ